MAGKSCSMTCWIMGPKPVCQGIVDGGNTNAQAPEEADDDDEGPGMSNVFVPQAFAFIYPIVQIPVVRTDSENEPDPLSEEEECVDPSSLPTSH